VGVKRASRLILPRFRGQCVSPQMGAKVAITRPPEMSRALIRMRSQKLEFWSAPSSLLLSLNNSIYLEA